MALAHASSGQVIGVGPLGATDATRQSHALIKSRDLEVLRLVLPAGRTLPPHKVPGEVTIQCIEGCCELSLANGTVRLHAAELVFLAANEVHGVTAVTDCSALVTIALVTPGA